MSRSNYKTTEMNYKVILNFIGLHLKTEIKEALVANSKHHRSPYISTTFMRFPCKDLRLLCVSSKTFLLHF
ncbi:hypothetical protein DN37_3197 [Vibrio cholerae]|nr:hypothetical protein DN37_3197 [Vibrio cholerae]